MTALTWHHEQILSDAPEHWPDDGIPTRKDLAPGTAHWEYHRESRSCLEYVCPCGCGHVRTLPVTTATDRKSNDARGWGWDGNKEQPTLSPSIHCTSHCGWHGYLRNGIWETC